jgi:hypothetical protein
MPSARPSPACLRRAPCEALKQVWVPSHTSVTRSLRQKASHGKAGPRRMADNCNPSHLAITSRAPTDRQIDSTVLHSWLATTDWPAEEQSLQASCRQMAGPAACRSVDSSFGLHAWSWPRAPAAVAPAAPRLHQADRQQQADRPQVADNGQERARQLAVPAPQDCFLRLLKRTG